jgi:hypothetical protein
MGKITPLLQAVSAPVGPPPPTTTAPTIQWVADSGPGITNGNGTEGVGTTIRLSVNFSKAVNVTGTPSLALNDNGTANYVSGSGTNTLQFDYTVAAGQNTPDLAIAGFNLGGVKDLAGNSVNLAGAPTQPPGTLAIHTTTDTTAPTIQWVAASGPGITNGNGTDGAGRTIRLSVNFSEAVNVTGTPSLALNSKGTAEYVSGSGTSTLQFDYTVAIGQKTADLAITGFNLSGVKDLAGNSVNLAGAPTQPAGTLDIYTKGWMSAASTNLTTAPSLSVTTLADSEAGISNPTPSANVAPSSSTTATPNMALLTQYAASSFAGSTPGVVGSSAQPAWSGFAQTLAKPNA